MVKAALPALSLRWCIVFFLDLIILLINNYLFSHFYNLDNLLHKKE